MKILIIADEDNGYYLKLALEVTQLLLMTAGCSITIVSPADLGGGLLDLEDYAHIVHNPNVETIKRLLNRGNGYVD